jgi:hypothetical protein
VVIVGDRDAVVAQDVADSLPAREGLMAGAGGHHAACVDITDTEVMQCSTLRMP